MIVASGPNGASPHGDPSELDPLTGRRIVVLAFVIFVKQRSVLKPLVRDGLVVPVDELFPTATAHQFEEVVAKFLEVYGATLVSDRPKK